MYALAQKNILLRRHVMKNLKKLLSVLLAVVFVLSMMVACNPTVEGPGESSTPTETDPPVPKKDPITLTTDYVVVRPEICNDAVEDAAISLTNALSDALGTRVSIKEDFLYGDMKPADYEILIGQTNREESAAVLETIKYHDYSISIEGKKLVIAAYTDDQVTAAVAEVIAMIEGADGEIKITDEDQKTVNAEYPLDAIKFGDNELLRDYTIILPSTTSNAMKQQVQKLQLAICDLTGELIPIKGESIEETDKEILIGDTKRAASTPIDSAALGAYGYAVKVDGTKLVIKFNDRDFTMMKTINDLIADMSDDGKIEPAQGNKEIVEQLSMFCFTDVHNNFAMLEPTNSTGDYIVRKNVDLMIDHMLATEGAVDLVMVGGDLMSDYPHWDKSGNWPYKYFVEYRQLLVDTFSRLSKDGKVVFCGGNHDYGQGEAATDCPHTEDGNYNSSDFYFGDVGMRQSIGELPEEDMFWKIGEHTGDKYLICYYYKINGVHVMGLAPDPDIIWSKQGDGFSEESLEWMSKKLDEIDPTGTEVIFVNCHYPLDNTYEQEDGTIKMSHNKYNADKLTPVYAGHKNLFHFFGHWESWYHDNSVKAVIHYNRANKPVTMKGTETNSTQVLGFDSRSFNAVNMGHFRPMFNSSQDMFYKGIDEIIKGYGGYNTYAIQHGSTRTPKCGQGMYVQVYEDRIEFTMKNIGTYAGLTTEDILSTYTVYLYK